MLPGLFLRHPRLGQTLVVAATDYTWTRTWLSREKVVSPLGSIPCTAPGGSPRGAISQFSCIFEFFLYCWVTPHRKCSFVRRTSSFILISAAQWKVPKGALGGDSNTRPSLGFALPPYNSEPVAWNISWKMKKGFSTKSLPANPFPE